MLRTTRILKNNIFLAKYGFYDSLHLFSSLTIVELSKLTNAIRPQSLEHDAEDVSLHSTARDLLTSMAVQGNLASKDHVRMLEDIEQRLSSMFKSQDAENLDFRLGNTVSWTDDLGAHDTFLDLPGFLDIYGGFEGSAL